MSVGITFYDIVFSLEFIFVDILFGGICPGPLCQYQCMAIRIS